MGVRGVRINLASVGKTTLPLIESLAPSLDVKICLDHSASPKLPNAHTLPTQLPTPPDPYKVEGSSSLVRLLKSGQTWVKISAAYRITDNTKQRDMLKAIGMDLLRIAPHRVVWASDWTHTRFEGLDIRSFLVDCIDWCHGGAHLKDRLFRDNAVDLWG